jgi:4-hydroxy-2-oxoheptanedioate aldolase
MQASSPRPSQAGLVNPLRARIQSGKPVFGVMATIPSVAVAQVLATSGFDYLKVDMEHSPIDMTMAHAMFTATAGTACTPVVRVPQNMPWVIKQVLDLGAFGVCIPLVRNAEDAVAAAAATHYDLKSGVRGWGPFYSSMRWGVTREEYVQQADTQVNTELLIEQAEAIDNIEAICEVPGIDTAFIAPQDLAVSLGYPGQPEHPAVLAQIERAEKAILKSGKALGGFAPTPEKIRIMLDKGYKVLTVAFDFMMLQRGAEQLLRGVKF